MNMSMDKPIALSSTVGTGGPQVKNARIEIPGLGSSNMNMSMDKPIALGSTVSMTHEKNALTSPIVGPKRKNIWFHGTLRPKI